jgi:Helix-turn-helix domain
MDDNGEVVATRRRRKMKSRKQWKKYSRPGKGELLNIDELASALGENVRTIRNWRSKGLIPVLVLGHKTLRFRLDAVLAALEKRQIKGRRLFYEQAI